MCIRDRQKLCDEGFAKRYPDDDGTVRARLQYEIDMIAQMGFVDYFLIVSDFIGLSLIHIYRSASWWPVFS